MMSWLGRQGKNSLKQGFARNGAHAPFIGGLKYSTFCECTTQPCRQKNANALFCLVFLGSMIRFVFVCWVGLVASGLLCAASQAQESSPEISLAAPPSAETQRYRMRIALYVSSMDEKHLNDVLRTAFKVAEKYPSVVMAEIYHIGDYRHVSESLQREAAARKIFMTAIHQPPKNLNLITSPAWVLRDSQGIHIVEGVIAIDKCIDENGEYREPQGYMFQQPATPTIGVKSF
jgi:hypothetical protein